MKRNIAHTSNAKESINNTRLECGLVLDMFHYRGRIGATRQV